MTQPRGWSSGRIVGLDMARWFALIGMIATHALVTTRPDGHPTLVQSIAGGRSAALFAVLAGVSMALMSGGPQPARGRDLRGLAAGFLVRAGLITAIGMLIAEFGSTIAIILGYYGLLFALGIPFLRLGAGALAVLAAVWAVAAPALSLWVRPMLSAPDISSPHFSDLFRPLELITALALTGWYPAFTWLAYLLLGMAIGRTAVDRLRTAVVLVGAGTLLATAATAASSWLLSLPGATAELAATLTDPPGRATLTSTLELGASGVVPTGSAWWLAVDAPHSGTTLDLAQTGGSAMAVIGACLLVARLAPRVLAVVFGAGAMSLSLYTLHVILRSPDLLAEDSPGTFWLHVAIVTVIGAWFRFADRSGPLERVVAKASRGARRRVAGGG